MYKIRFDEETRYEKGFILPDEDLSVSFEVGFSIKDGIRVKENSIIIIPLDGKRVSEEDKKRIMLLLEEEEAMINLYQYLDYYDDFINDYPKGE